MMVISRVACRVTGGLYLVMGEGLASSLTVT